MVRSDGAPTIAWANPPEDDEQPSCPVVRLSTLPGVKRVKLSREVAAAMSDSELRAWIESIPAHVAIEILPAREEHDDGQVAGLSVA